MELIRSNLKINFMGMRKFAYTASLLAVVGALVCVLFISGIRFGVDFTGGVEIQARFNSADITAAQLREFLAGEAFDASVQSFGNPADHEFLIHVGTGTQEDLNMLASNVRQALTQHYQADSIEFRAIEVVGAKVGAELRYKALMSVLFAIIGILIYVAIRFEFRYAIGSVVALIHDITIVIGLFSIMGKEFNLPIIAALLTILGYSLNDTIVVYDRIRETRQRKKRAPLAPTINEAINETLSRTTLTSLTTLLTVAALFFLTQANSVIHDFAFAMFAGIVVGTYSSIFVASPILLFRYKETNNG